MILADYSIAHMHVLLAYAYVANAGYSAQTELAITYNIPLLTIPSYLVSMQQPME
jgi:hypothetical protein